MSKLNSWGEPRVPRFSVSFNWHGLPVVATGVAYPGTPGNREEPPEDPYIEFESVKVGDRELSALIDHFEAWDEIEEEVDKELNVLNDDYEPNYPDFDERHLWRATR